jgi:DNA-binding NtrC family response regulator
MVRGFAEQSGGCVDFQSVPGRGTKVTLLLPITKTHSKTDEDTEYSQDQSACDLSIALIEDDLDLSNVLAVRMKQFGCSVRVIHGGSEAIDVIYSPNDFDVFICDLRLRDGISGIDVIREITKHRPSTGIVAITGNATSQKDVDWLHHQNIRLIRKPFKASDLVSEALRVCVRDTHHD